MGVRRDDGLGALALEAGPQAADVQRRPGTPLHDGEVARLTEEPGHADAGGEGVLVEGQRCQRLVLGRGELADVVVEARHADAARAVVQRGQDAHQGDGGVLDEAAEAARVQVLAGTPHVHLQVGVAAQADRDRGMVALEEARVGHDHEVRLEACPVGQQPGLEVRRACLLLALDDVAHVEGQPAGRGQPGLRRPEVEVHLALVVGHAARVDPPALDPGLEGRPDPLLERVDRLDVVVGVDDDGGCPRGLQPVGVDHGVAGGLGDIDVLQSDVTHAPCQPLGPGSHVGVVIAQHPDGRDAQELDVAPRGAAEPCAPGTRRSWRWRRTCCPRGWSRWLPGPDGRASKRTVRR